MATGAEVLSHLCDGVQWVISGDDYDSIQWHDGAAAITKKQFEDGFSKVDELKAKTEADKAAAKASARAKLAALGLTEDEVRAIIGA